MLLEFSVANYLSFKERAVFSMLASKDDTLEESNVFAVGKKRLLKSAVIYGANASGKSNLLSAMLCMRRMVKESSKDSQANEDIDVECFKLNIECDDKPSFFEIVFNQNNCMYRYGFEADNKRIHSEWLFSIPRAKEVELFVRDGQQIKVHKSQFKEGLDLGTKTRENALFLSVCAQFNGAISKELLLWFQDFRFVHGLSDLGYLERTVDLLKDIKQKDKIMGMAHIADLSIDNIEGVKRKLTLEDLPKTLSDDVKKEIVKNEIMQTEMKTLHKKYGKEGEEIGTVTFDLNTDESGGTVKFLTMTGPLLDTLQEGTVLVIDELDARLHPLLTQAIIKLFNSITNSKNAQLIFVTHDVSLLTNQLFRRDQIWFTEKDTYGGTDLYSLSSLLKVRKTASFGKDYILGKYGAIPFIGDTKLLYCEANNE
jgi:uncharacterized protein